MAKYCQLVPKQPDKDDAAHKEPEEPMTIWQWICAIVVYILSIVLKWE